MSDLFPMILGSPRPVALRAQAWACCFQAPPASARFVSPLYLASLGFLLVAALFFGGCDSTNVLGGVWRAVGTPTGDPIIGAGMTLDSPLGVELVLGHYGPDVTGLLRFYRNAEYTLPRYPGIPSKECGCAFLHQGRWSDNAERLNFVLKGCLPGAATTQTVYVRGDLTLDEDGTLTGSLQVEDPASAYFGKKQAWVFERFSSVSSSDLTCEPVTDADAGNTANGR